MKHSHRFVNTHKEIIAEWSKGNWPEQCRLRIDGFLAVCECGRGAIVPRDPHYQSVELENFTDLRELLLPAGACSPDPEPS